MKNEVYRKKLDTRDELPVNTLDVIACKKERQDALRRTTRHVFTRVAKCIDVDGGIFEHLLYTVTTLSLKQQIPVLEIIRKRNILINNFEVVHSNSSISETVRNRTHVHINIFA